jgi:hypothetical protein
VIDGPRGVHTAPLRNSHPWDETDETGAWCPVQVFSRRFISYDGRGAGRVDAAGDHGGKNMPAAPRSHDPLPIGAIRLSAAFEHFYRSTSPDATAIEAGLRAAYADIENARQTWGPLGARQLEAALARWRAASEAQDASRRRAEWSFREMLATGGLIARVRDPASGEILQLSDYESWSKRASFGVPGFTDDFVGPDELMQPGPSGAIIGGAMRPVFFVLAELEAVLPPVGSAGIETVDQQGTDRWSIPQKEPRGTRRAAAWRQLPERCSPPARQLGRQ